MQDISLLVNLDLPNQHLSSVWALMPSLSPTPSPHLPNLPFSLVDDNDKQEKGSKFAKFIAERNKDFGSSTQLGKVKKTSSGIIPSKL